MKKAIGAIIGFSSLLFFSCAGAAPAPGVPGEESPSGAAPSARPSDVPALSAEKSAPALRFVPVSPAAEASAVPASVGAFPSSIALGSERKVSLAAAFRAAYAEALARGIPLSGVLGGDLVHFWKGPSKRGAEGADSVGAYVQNWKEPRAVLNAWGLKDLLLASVVSDGSRVVLVRGALLDAYSRGGGQGGANGVAGYGAALGDEFRVAGVRAQRFEFGLLQVRDDGVASFTAEAAPSAAGIPDEVGILGPDAPASLSAASRAALRVSFRAAWSAAVNAARPIAASDGPVFSVAGPWGSAWVQTFGDRTWGLVLASGDSSVGGARPRILDRPFLAAVEKKRGVFDFSDYGLPVSDSFWGEKGQVCAFEKGRLEN